MTDLMRFSQEIRDNQDWQAQLATVSEQESYLRLIVELATQRGYSVTLKEAIAFIF